MNRLALMVLNNFMFFFILEKGRYQEGKTAQVMVDRDKMIITIIEVTKNVKKRDTFF